MTCEVTPDALVRPGRHLRQVDPSTGRLRGRRRGVPPHRARPAGSPAQRALPGSQGAFRRGALGWQDRASAPRLRVHFEFSKIHRPILPREGASCSPIQPRDAAMVVREGFRRPFSTPPIKLGETRNVGQGARVQPSAMRRRLTSRSKATTRSSVTTVTSLSGSLSRWSAPWRMQRPRRGADWQRLQKLESTARIIPPSPIEA